MEIITTRDLPQLVLCEIPNRKTGRPRADIKYKADKFVRVQFDKAKVLLKEGKIDEAYYEFGIGLHTLQDATSPAHSGFQVWTGEESDAKKIKHVLKEYKYPGRNSNLQKITNKYLEWFEKSDQPLSSENLFNKIQFD